MSSSEIIQRVAALVSGNRATSVGSAAVSDAENSDSENNGTKKKRFPRLRKMDGSRVNHLRQLVSERHARQRYLSKLLRRDSLPDIEDVEAPPDGSPHQPTRRGRKPKTPEQVEEQDEQGSDEAELRESAMSTDVVDYELSEVEKDEMQKMSETMKSVKRTLDQYKDLSYNFPVEIRIDNLSYTATVTASSNKIKTVYNSSVLYKIVKFCKKIGHKEASDAHIQSTKVILDRISLSLKPGKMYLLLGPPSSGKTTLLKAIAGRLSLKNGEQTTGSVTYNGRSFKDKNHFHIENAIAFVDQLDRHAPRMTVEETFEFAFQCKNGGTHAQLADFDGDEGKLKHTKEMAKRADDERLLVNTNLKSLGLEHVKDTFVGNDDVRGVSGGQRRRVTVGEMMLGATPVFLGDEISNGLDAASTFEMVQILTYLTKDYERVRVISLLQPSPETVSLFDEIILVADGKVLFAGPITVVEDYFAQLGYSAPPYMDVADFLQMLSVPADCEALFQPPPEIANSQTKPYTTDQLAEIFRASIYGQQISASLKAPHKHVWGSSHGGISVDHEAHHLDDRRYYRKYMNSFPRSIMLNMKRNLLLWIRDRRVLIANALKNIIMGISVGGVFHHTDDVVSILGAFFQGTLFIMLGAMTIAPSFVDERVIYYKQADANFFASFPFVIGKSLAKLPQTILDCFTFGTIMYFMVGLAPYAKNYFIFMAILIVFMFLMNEFLFVFATFARTKDMVQVVSACVVFFFILFSGFIIPPNVVPSYYEWIYWYCPLSWAYRALVINEYRSPEYTTEEGDQILEYTGFVDPDGVPFTMEWVGYTFIYLVSHSLITMVLSGFFLKYVRVYNISGVSDDEVGITANQGNQPTESSGDTNISFKPVTLTFENICYDVQASKGGETLRLLHEVNGAFRDGRMCALMGSSGAGKTTLMDVIAMRKTSGTVQGDIRLNGFPQDPVAFRRCSGFVEQFDVQTPQLTVRETVLFSARLRIDVLKVEKDEDKQAFVDYVLKTLELTPLADVLVGSSSEGGLTFEQKKRLSIAVELAASPSILFLDEPTTGLDARSALLVVRLLRKIADQGRTICATIHQPSSAVFEMFDDLLLLKKGGRVVYFGETGEQSKNLINYFESNGARRIEMGDNPANWMLREMDSPERPNDLADVYVQTEDYKLLKESLKEVQETQIEALEITFPTKFAAPPELRQRLVNKRLQTIYWRSPAYNLSRLLVCCIIAFILGSVFLGDRNPPVLTESDMRAQLSVIFLSFTIIGILSITTVLPVMLSIRDVFYRHRQAGMLDNISLGWALGTAEKWFIVLASFLFCLVQVGVTGVASSTLGRTIRFWAIFTFNLAIYSYFGQAFMCLVRSMATAQILASVFIGLNNFFSGLIVRPQFMTTGFFAFTYWITPGHYVYEGLVIAQFNGDNRTVVAMNGTAFYDFLGCTNTTADCYGTVDQYIYVFFGGRFNADNQLQDILVLALFLVVARVLTFYALKKYNFSNT